MRYSASWNTSGQLKDSAIIIAVGVFFFLAHRISYFFPDSEKVLMVTWPAGGIGLAALLLNCRKLWPAIIIAMFIAGNAANLILGRPLLKV